MRDSYEFKRKSIEIYRNGIHPDTFDGVSKELVRDPLRKGLRIEETQGNIFWKIKNEMYYSCERDYFSFEKFSKAVEESIDSL